MIQFDCMITDCNIQDQMISKYIEYPELLSIVGDFKITIDRNTFFEQPYFPVIEFVRIASSWMNNDLDVPMLYHSVETEDNPLISFTKTTNGWNITSPWQEYSCDLYFSKEELTTAIINLKQSLIRQYIGFKELLG